MMLAMMTINHVDVVFLMTLIFDDDIDNSSGLWQCLVEHTWTFENEQLIILSRQECEDFSLTSFLVIAIVTSSDASMPNFWMGN